jgi:conjugal transfer/entry exclusion protein
LATLIIVAVVIIMAALTVEVKASPVFDRTNLKEEWADSSSKCNIVDFN